MSIASPSINDVICGGSRYIQCHPGNQRFHILINDYLFEYEVASKKERSNIISEIIKIINNSTSKNGGFVQKGATSKDYFVVTDRRARERTAQAFRDALHEKYRSSKISKKSRLVKKRNSNQNEPLSTISRDWNCYPGVHDHSQYPTVPSFPQQQQQQQQTFITIDPAHQLPQFDDEPIGMLCCGRSNDSNNTKGLSTATTLISNSMVHTIGAWNESMDYHNYNNNNNSYNNNYTSDNNNSSILQEEFFLQSLADDDSVMQRQRHHCHHLEKRIVPEEEDAVTFWNELYVLVQKDTMTSDNSTPTVSTVSI